MLLIYKHFYLTLAVIQILFFAQKIYAEEKTFGEHIVHTTVFNSSLITPKVASTYQLVRGKNRALVNVAVTSDNSPTGVYGLPATVSGVAKNLLQQRTELEFIQIKEPNATYYLAPFKFSHEEVLHFKLEVILPNGKKETIEFDKKLYVDGR